MNTMIPKKVRFGLDLQDLPARATQVAHEALSLSAIEGSSGFCQNARIDLGYTTQNSVFQLIDYCGWRCKQLNGSDVVKYKYRDSLFGGNTSCGCGSPC